MLATILAWVQNPVQSFRRQTWRQINENLKFLEANTDGEFKSLPYEKRVDFAVKFMVVQRNRIMIARLVVVAVATVIAFAFLKH